MGNKIIPQLYKGVISKSALDKYNFFWGRRKS